MQGVFHSTNARTIRLGVYAIIAPSAKAAMLLMMILPSTRFVQAHFSLWQLCVNVTGFLADKNIQHGSVVVQGREK
jgi:hypothetical protein